MSNEIKEEKMTILKEIHKDSLKKYIALAEADNAFERNGVNETKEINGFLEITFINYLNEENEKVEQKVISTNVLLQVHSDSKDLTLIIKVF